MRLLRVIRPYWGSLGKGIMLGLVLGIFGMVTPYLSKLLIDEVYPSRNVTLMHVLVLGILAVAVSQSVMGAIRAYFTTYTTSHLGNATTLLFFNHLQHLRVRFFDEHRVGEIMSRFGDVRTSLQSISRIFETIFVNGIYLFLVPPFLFLLQWKLAVVALITIPLTVLLTVVSARVLRKLWKKSAEAYADLGAYQVEVLSHIRTLKALSMEHDIYKRVDTQVKAALNVNLKAGGLGQVFGLINSIIRAGGTALFTWYGWTLIIRGEMSLGDYIAFTAYMGYLYNPLQSITNLFSDFQQTAVNLGRMFEYLDMPVEKDPATAYLPPVPIVHSIKGDVRLRDVSFGYSEEKRVLHDVTLHFPRGMVTAVVGPSGAGKSSLLRLVTRMEEPDSGQVFFDGRPAGEMSLSDIRRQVAVVWTPRGDFRHPQEVALLWGRPEDAPALETLFSGPNKLVRATLCGHHVLASGEDVLTRLRRACEGKSPNMLNAAGPVVEGLRAPTSVAFGVNTGRLLGLLAMDGYWSETQVDVKKPLPRAAPPEIEAARRDLETLPYVGLRGTVKEGSLVPGGFGS